MNRFIASLGAGLLAAGLASANDFESFRGTYAKEMEAIAFENGLKMTTLGRQYTEALNVLLGTVKEAGDLDKTTAVLEEIARFSKDTTMPGMWSHLPDIQNLQQAFARDASRHEREKAKQIISLAARYDQALERLQRSLVSSDRLEEARAVQEERRRIGESNDYQAAKAIVTSPGEGDNVSGAGKPPAAAEQDETYTLTVVVKTGTGKNDPSDGSDRVRMVVFLNDEDRNKQELICGGFGRGSEIAFEGIKFDCPPENIRRISLLCQGGTDAWGMDRVSFQFFRGDMASQRYLFEERTGFSGEGADGATTLKSFQIPGGVAINRVALKPGGRRR